MAIADYDRVPGAILFTHTEVPPEHAGEGVGTMLIKAGLAYARQQGLMVVPTCAFFAAYMKGHAEVHDLLDGDQHKVLHIS